MVVTFVNLTSSENVLISVFPLNILDSEVKLRGNPLSSKFQGNSLIHNLELQYFSSLGGLSADNPSILNNLSSLVQVHFPDHITTIGGILQNCNSLDFSNIIFPSNLEVINGRFMLASKMTSSKIDIPEGVTKVDGYLCMGAVSSNRSYRFVLPSTLTSCGIGNKVFYIRSFTYGVCKSLTPPTLTGNPLQKSSKCNIYVPDESVDVYKAASYWSSWASYIKGFSDFATAYPDDAEELGLV